MRLLTVIAGHMKGEIDSMKNLLKSIRKNFILACEAYYNTFIR